MRYWYDCEFLEDGSTITPISIGIVAEDGREYYAVEAYANDRPAYAKIRRHDWLMENVVPHLPLVPTMYRPTRGDELGWFILDQNDPAVKPRRHIAEEVRDFLLNHPPNELVELWGWYSAYDHIMLAQLFGPMAAMPKGIPWLTYDLQQLMHDWELDGFSLPVQESTQHHALEDARWTKQAWEYVRGLVDATQNESRYP